MIYNWGLFSVQPKIGSQACAMGWLTGAGVADAKRRREGTVKHSKHRQKVKKSRLTWKSLHLMYNAPELVRPLPTMLPHNLDSPRDLSGCVCTIVRR